MTINLCKKNLRGTQAMTINLQAGSQNPLQKEKKIENQFAGWNSKLSLEREKFENQVADWNSKLS